MRIATLQTAARPTVVLTEGEPSTSLVLLLSGAAEVAAGGGVTIALSEGHFTSLHFTSWTAHRYSGVPVGPNGSRRSPIGGDALQPQRRVEVKSSQGDTLQP